MRGDPEAPLMFDPALAMHSSVMRDQYWKRLQHRTGAILVSGHMCALRDGYPPKPEDFMLSPNLRDSLGVKLSSLACPHPTGTHKGKFGADISISKTWLPELCRILVDAVSHVTPSGGSSLRLGVDDASEFAMDALRTKRYGELDPARACIDASRERQCSRASIIETVRGSSVDLAGGRTDIIVYSLGCVDIRVWSGYAWRHRPAP